MICCVQDNERQIRGHLHESNFTKVTCSIHFRVVNVLMYFSVQFECMTQDIALKHSVFTSVSYSISRSLRGLYRSHEERTLLKPDDPVLFLSGYDTILAGDGER
jgi:hypothetical protein